MRRAVGKLTLVLVLLYAGILYADGGLHPYGLTVEEAWIRQAPPVAKVMAGYLKIHNPTDKALVLQGAESSLFDKVEIHRTEMKDGMAGMKRQKYLEIPAHGQVEFAPGGLHLMLIGPKKAFSAGDTVSITLLFEGGQTLPVQFTVRPMGGAGQHHHH